MTCVSVPTGPPAPQPAAALASVPTLSTSTQRTPEPPSADATTVPVMKTLCANGTAIVPHETFAVTVTASVQSPPMARNAGSLAVPVPTLTVVVDGARNAGLFPVKSALRQRESVKLVQSSGVVTL